MPFSEGLLAFLGDKKLYFFFIFSLRLFYLPNLTLLVKRRYYTPPQGCFNIFKKRKDGQKSAFSNPILEVHFLERAIINLARGSLIYY